MAVPNAVYTPSTTSLPCSRRAASATRRPYSPAWCMAWYSGVYHSAVLARLIIRSEMNRHVTS